MAAKSIFPISESSLFPSSEGAPKKKAPLEDFQQVLSQAIAEVDQKQKEAEKLLKEVATGEVQDLHQVILAMEEAGIALRLALQIRNKIIEAYQEISRMQL